MCSSPADSTGFLRSELDSLLPHLLILNEQLTRIATVRLSKRLAGENMKYGDVAENIEDITKRLSDELSFTKTFVLEQERHGYYDSPSPIFGEDVRDKFVGSSFEIDEAAKCFALSRPTACVFHLMRVMEIAVRAVARCLAIPDPTKPAERN